MFYEVFKSKNNKKMIMEFIFILFFWISILTNFLSEINSKEQIFAEGSKTTKNLKVTSKGYFFIF